MARFMSKTIHQFETNNPYYLKIIIQIFILLFFKILNQMTMTKLNNYFLRFLAISGILFLYSCGDEDPVPTSNPTISITAGDFDDNNEATGEAGDVVTASLTVSAEGGFNTLRITKSGGEPFDKIVETKTAGEAGPTQFTTTFTYTLVEEEEGETVTFTVQAVDDTDDASTGSITLTVVTEEPASPEARVYTAVLLSGPLGLPSSAKTFFSTNTGERYSPSDVTNSGDPISADIDFGYFEGDPSGANLASPLAFNTNSNAGISAQTNSWGTFNNTVFRTTELASADFLEIVTWADIDNVFDTTDGEITDPDNITGLVVGDVIGFTTDATKDGGAKRGLIEIISITPGTGVDSAIELEITVQEEAN